jgi:hypothetical protein
MKRGTANHPKMTRLAKALRMRRWGAVGIMESLWHFTARHAIRGDIGRWSDGDIAEALDWAGDPSNLVSALVETGWLDEHPTHRLLVHDWHEHADDSVKKTLKNRGETFATLPENSGSIPEESRNGSPQPEPKPEPEPIEESSKEDSLVPSHSSPPADATSGYYFAVRNGKLWTLPQRKLDEYLANYGDRLDVDAELRKAKQWLIDNAGRRKTATGMPSFLTRWLNRAYDSRSPQSLFQQPDRPPAREVT